MSIRSRLKHHPKATLRRARGSSIRRLTALLAGVTLVTATAPSLRAQAPTRAQLDSLQQRVEDAEATLQMLREQLATEATSGVRTRSRIGLELNGRVLMNAFVNSKETNNVDVPMYRAVAAPGIKKGGIGIAIRQTTLGAALSVPDVLGGAFTGDLDVDFYGGQIPSPGGRTFPLIRLRTARGIIAWDDFELLFGQEQPLVSGLNPVSLASVGVPGFSYAGNLWLWLPQVRGTWETGERFRLGLQGAILAPTSGDPNGVFDTGYDAAEKTKIPYLQGRVRLGWGDEEAPAEVGVGFHTGQVNDANAVAQPSRAVTADFLVPIGPRFEVRGEFFTGQVLNGLGGGGIGQNFGIGGLGPVYSTGAWVQLNYELSPRLLIGAGYGFDDPDDDDVDPVGSKFNNTVQELHLHWRPAGPLVLGFEWRSMSTKYDLSNYGNSHLNFAFGFEF
jgi:hypothetical protein